MPSDSRPSSRSGIAEAKSAPEAARGELWLFRPGSSADLASRLQDFAAVSWSVVLAPAGGPEEAWARPFAEQAGAALLPLTASATETEGDAALRLWPEIEARVRGGARVLVVLGDGLLQTVVALALGFPPSRAGALRVDPGRGVLLRAEPAGILLRRSNVRAPEVATGTSLPGLSAERS